MVKKLNDLRARHEKFETFRTPDYSYKPLLDYRPEWFVGSGFDPSAGDGRMLLEVKRRSNRSKMFLNDIREEELQAMKRVGHATSADYLTMEAPPPADFMITNPPFTKSVEFVEKAKTHVTGPICILQSIAWQSTQQRSQWLKQAGLAYVLNLPRRPKWEVSDGTAPSSMIRSTLNTKNRVNMFAEQVANSSSTAKLLHQSNINRHNEQEGSNRPVSGQPPE